MNRILKTALVFILFVFSGKVNAAVIDSGYLKEKINESIEQQIKTELHKDIKVQVVSIPFQIIETNSEDIQVKAQINLKYLNQTMLARVSIISNGAVNKSFTVQAKLNIDQPQPKIVQDIKTQTAVEQIIKPSPVIIRENTISIIFKSENVSVTIPGVAMSNGSLGDYIKVKSNDYKKLYQGKIIGQNLVLVNI